MTFTDLKCFHSNWIFKKCIQNRKRKPDHHSTFWQSLSYLASFTLVESGWDEFKWLMRSKPNSILSNKTRWVLLSYRMPALTNEPSLTAMEQMIRWQANKGKNSNTVTAGMWNIKIMSLWIDIVRVGADTTHQRKVIKTPSWCEIYQQENNKMFGTFALSNMSLIFASHLGLIQQRFIPRHL